MDLQRFFNTKLTDMFTDPVRESPRRILKMAEHAARWEPTSRLRAAILGRDYYQFGRAEQMLADIFDANWAIAYARSGVKDADPPMYPRPGRESRPARQVRGISVAQIAQITGRR